MITTRMSRACLSSFILLFASTAVAQAPPPEFLAGHTAAVNAAIYTPDQRHVITTGADQTIRIWDATTGKEIRALAGHTGPVLSVASSPDSLTMVTGAGDNTLRMWDVPRSDPVRVFPLATTAPDVAVSSDGKWAVSFGEDKTGQVWNLQDGSAAMLLKGMMGAPSIVAVRNDANQIVSGDTDGRIWSWETLEGALNGQIIAHQGRLRGLAFHPNNQQLISSGEDGLLKVWQLPFAPPRELAGHTSPIRSAVVTSTGLAITGGEAGVWIHQMANGQPVRELTNKIASADAVAVAPNNSVVAAAGPQGTLQFWNLADGADRLQIMGHDTPIHALAFHPDNARIASAGADGTIRLWRLPTAPLALAGHTADVVSVAIGDDGATAATASADKSVRLWNAATGQPLRTLSGHTEPLRQVILRADNAQVASGDASGEVRFWNLADGAAQGVFGAHAATLEALAYSASGEQMATIGNDGLLKVWKLPRAPTLPLAGNTAAVTSAAITSDGKLILIGGADKSVRVFDAVTAQQTRTMPDVPEAVTALALSSEDRWTVAGASNGVIKIWNTADASPFMGETPPADGQPAAPSVLAGHDGAITSLQFDSKSKRIVSAGADGTVRVWRLPTAARQIEEVAGASTRFIVSPDGKRSATAGTFQDKPAVIVRDLTNNGRIVTRLLGHQAPITAIGFQRDGSKVISGGANGECSVWNLADAKFPLLQTTKFAAAVTAVALSDDGGQLFASVGNGIHQHTVADAAEVRVLNGHTAAVASLVVVGPTLLSGAADNTIRGWTIATGAAAGQMNHGAAVISLTASADGKIVASAGADHAIKLWNTAGGAAISALTGLTAPAVAIQFNPAGTKLASVGGDGLWIWDHVAKRRLESIALAPAEPRGVGFVGDELAIEAADGKLQLLAPYHDLVIDAHPGGVECIRLTPDDSRVVTCGADKTLKLWNVVDGKNLATFAGPTDVVRSIAVSSDGTQLIGAGADKMLRVWTIPAAVSPQPIAAANEWELPAAATSLDLAGDNRRVVIADEDKVVHVWDLDLGRELERWSAHTDVANAVAFTPSGNQVVTASADATAQLATLALSHIAAIADAGSETPYDLAFLPDGKLVVAGVGTSLQVWTLGDEVELKTPIALPKPENVGTSAPAMQVGVAVHRDGSQIASIDVAGRVHVWTMPDGKLAYAIPASVDEAARVGIAPNAAPPIGQIAYSGDQSKLVVGHGSAARMHDAPSGRMLQQWREPAPITAVAAAPNGSTLIGHAGAANNATLRGFSLERLIEAHEGSVRSLAFTADGSGLVSGGQDKLVRLWTTSDGAMQRSFGGSTDEINCVALTRDGAKVIAGGVDKTVRMWLRNPPAPADGNAQDPVGPSDTFAIPAAISSLQVSPDNLKLAVACDDNAVRVLDLAAGHTLQQFDGHDQAALAVAFAADNKALLSVSEKAARVDTLSLVRAIRASEGPVQGLAIAGAGAQAVTASQEGVKQWNLSSGALLRSFEPPVQTPAAAAPATATPAAAPATAPATEEPPKPPLAFVAVATRADNTQVAAVDAENNLLIWNLANGQIVAQRQLDADVRKLQYSPDNQKLVAVCQDNHLRFFNPADGELTYELASDKPLVGATFTTDSRTVLTAGAEIRQWRFASPVAVRTMTGHGGPVLGVTFSPTGRWIASSSVDQTVRIWDANTGAQVKQLSGHVGAVYSVAFSPDESLLVSSGAEKGLRVWDVLGGRQLKQIPVGQDSLYTVTFLSDGKRIAAAGIERKIYVLNLLTGELQNTLEQHSDYLYRIALNATGTRMLSCGYGGNVKLWNTANNQLLFETSIGQVANFADFAPDGQRIVIASDNGKAYFVDVPANAR